MEGTEHFPGAAENHLGKGRNSASGSKSGRNSKESDAKSRQESQLEKLAKQIFVGGLPGSITQEKFREWADETWPGSVSNVQVIFTKNQERFHHCRPRGFGFVTFCDASIVEKALEIRHRPFGPKIVELKKAEDCRGKKPGRKEPAATSSASSKHGEQEARLQKQHGSSSPSYPPGPAELLTNVISLNISEDHSQEGTGMSGEASLLTEPSPSAGGESQGPLHATGHQGSPLRQQNLHSPRPSQGPQCGGTSSGDDGAARRNGRRGCSGSVDRRARGVVSPAETRSEGPEVAEERLDVHVAANSEVADTACGIGRGPSVDAVSGGPDAPSFSATEHSQTKTIKPVYDDSIRQLLRERWDAAVGS